VIDKVLELEKQKKALSKEISKLKKIERLKVFETVKGYFEELVSEVAWKKVSGGLALEGTGLYKGNNVDIHFEAFDYYMNGQTVHISG
jgi:hypothetical protein